MKLCDYIHILFLFTLLFVLSSVNYCFTLPGCGRYRWQGN